MERLLLLTCLALLFPATAAAEAPRRAPADIEVLNNAGFLAAHPDLRWRNAAQAALDGARPDEAFTYFRRAARYADKPSQAMLGEMLWTGRGMPVDRPLAYAWMDIAAERAYIPFVVRREQYWEALDAAERERALEIGRPLFDEYGDAVAKKRLERVLDNAKRKITGSRTGFVGFLKVIVAGPGGNPITIDGERFYDDTYWEPAQYWAWQDSIWKDPPVGSVEVAPLEVVRGGEAGDAAD